MIGIDIENIDRFNSWTENNLQRIFSKLEIEYAANYKNYSHHLCGFYCVKEALVKALNDKKLKFTEIEVQHTVSGKPYLNKNTYILNLLKKYNYKDIEISISHNKDYAVAIVLLIK